MSIDKDSVSRITTTTSRRGLFTGSLAVGAAVAGSAGAYADARPEGDENTSPQTVTGVDLTGVENVFKRSIVHELAIWFPGWTTQLAAKNLLYFYPQAFGIYDGRLYILSGSYDSNHTTVGTWVSTYNWSSGAYISGFHLDASSAGEGIIVKQEGTTLALYARYSTTTMGRWDITTLPADGATLTVESTYSIGMYSQFTWSANDSKWLVQARDRGAVRSRFMRMKDDPRFEFDTELAFDPANMWTLTADQIPLNVKAQGIGSWGSGYAESYGGAFEFDQDVTPEKYCGIRLFTGTGDLVADGIMHPRKFADVLNDAGATVGLMEGEGCATYDGNLYALWVTQHWRASGDHTGDYGLIITRELVGDIDCSGAAAPGRLANITPRASEVAYASSGLRNPVTGATFNGLSDIIEFLTNAGLTRWAVYTTGSSLLDMDGSPIGSGLFVEIMTGNFISWNVRITGRTTLTNYWVITQSGYSGDVQHESSRYYISATQWIGGGSDAPEGSVAAETGCMWIRSNGELWLKTTGSGATGWTLK